MKPVHIYAFADEASPLIDGQIEAMQKNGVEGLEIRNVDNIGVSDITANKAREVRRKLDAAGLITWSIGSPIGKIGVREPFEPHEEKFRHTLEIAHLLGAKNLRLFSFYYPAGEDPAPYKNEVIERLSRLAELAKGSGVTLCHENEKGIYGDIAVRCAEILAAVPSLKAIFDPANFIQCGQDTLEAWQLLRPHVHYLHIKDALPDGRVVPAGAGEGHVREIVADYLGGVGNSVTIEPHLTVFDGLAGLEREGEQSAVGQAFVYPDAGAAFTAAVSAFRTIAQEV